MWRELGRGCEEENAVEPSGEAFGGVQIVPGSEVYGWQFGFYAAENHWEF